MAVWTRICCAVDLTSRAPFVLREAAKLARALDAELLIVHAGAKGAEAGALYSHPEVEEAEGQKVAQELEFLRRAAEDVRGAPVRAALLPEKGALEQITGFAKREKCDLLVVGAHHGHSIFEPLAEKLVRAAHCSVLTLRFNG